jgi:hypothetical protein
VLFVPDWRLALIAVLVWPWCALVPARLAPSATSESYERRRRRSTRCSSAICFLGGEYAAPFAFPGGNAGLARLLVKWLIKDAISGEPATSGNPTRSIDRPMRSGSDRARPW